MKKSIALFLSLILILSVCLIGCGNNGSTDTTVEQDTPFDPNNPDRPVDPNRPTATAKSVTGLAGAKLALANERLSGKLLDSNDSVFASAAEDMRSMAADGKAISQTLSVSATRPLAGITYDESEINAWSRNFTQFDEVVRRSVELAEACEDHITYMKEHVRVIDSWTTGLMGFETLLHVEENSELLLVRSDAVEYVFYRTKEADGSDRYEILQYYPEGNYSSRATYVKNQRYEYMYELPNAATGKNTILGFSAVKNGERWDCAELRYHPDNEAMGAPFDIWFVILTDTLCMGATQSIDPVRKISGISISDLAHTVDILNMTIPQEEAPVEFFFSVNLGAFSGYRGIQHDGDTGNGKLILADGTEIATGDFSKTVVLRNLIKLDSVVGVEVEMLMSVQATNAEQAVELLLKTLEQDWKLQCAEPYANIKATLSQAKQIAIAVNDSYKWNGYDVRTNEECYKALNAENERFSALRAMFIAWQDAPFVDPVPEQQSPADLIEFGELTDVVIDATVGEDGSILIRSASVTVSNLDLFEAGEAYHLAFALESDEGLIHLEGLETPTVTFDGEAFTLSCEGLTITLSEEFASKNRTLTVYVASSEGIRSCAPFAIFRAADEPSSK